MLAAGCLALQICRAEPTASVTKGAAVGPDLQALEAVVIAQSVVQTKQRKRDPKHTGVALLR